MQTKRFLPLVVVLFITSVIIAQEPVYTATINKTQLPEQSHSFQVTIAAIKNATYFNLWIDNPEKKKLQVEIRHYVLGTVMNEVVNQKQYSRRYNMETADDGRYKVIVKCGKEKIIKEVELNTITVRNVVVR